MGKCQKIVWKKFFYVKTRFLLNKELAGGLRPPDPPRLQRARLRRLGATAPKPPSLAFGAFALRADAPSALDFATNIT